MPPRVSVVIPPHAADSRALLASLDRQSLAAADFEVLVADDEQTPGLTTLLDDIVAHRTNLTRVPVAGDAAATLLDRARGDYVLAVPAGRTLTPHALELLLDAASAGDADACRGLTGRPGARPERLPAGEELVGPAGTLRRRAGLSVDVVAADLAGKDGDPDPDTRVTAVATALCFLDGPAPAAVVPPESGGVRARASSVAWRDGVLEVVADLSTAAEVVVASVYSHQSGVEWALPDATVDGTRVSFRVHPDHVPGPGALPEGVWWPSLRLGGDDEPLLVEVSPLAAHGATLRGRAVVSFAEGGRLALDVGGRTRQPLRRLDPSATTVEEDSRGSLLTSRVANIDLPAGERVAGQLRLGKMPVTAWLEHQPGAGAVLQAWVSGLAGEATLHTRFTRAPFAPTGAQLVIDGVGHMVVTPVTKEQAAAPAGGPAAAPRTPASTAGGALGRARRLAGRAKRAVRG